MSYQALLLQALLGQERQGCVESVHYNRKLQRLMVVLREGTPAGELAALAPDFDALLRSSTDASIRGVSVTLAAGARRSWRMLGCGCMHACMRMLGCGCMHACMRMLTAHDAGRSAGPSSGHDMLLRFFAPWSGINEDPVCGSASIMAGPFWAARLGRARFRVRQCSRRGGDLLVSVDAAAGRVDVAGAAVMVSKGVLYLH